MQYEAFQIVINIQTSIANVNRFNFRSLEFFNIYHIFSPLMLLLDCHESNEGKKNILKSFCDI